MKDTYKVTEFNFNDKRNMIQTAKDLQYGPEVVNQIKMASSANEVERILRTARINKSYEDCANRKKRRTRSK